MNTTTQSITDAQWVEFLQWALPQLGMRWPGYRKVRRQVCKRVRRRLMALGLEDLNAYRDCLARSAAEWSRLDACCRVSISRFYRDRDVFDFLRSWVLPELARRGTDAGRSSLRCWSVGCASGEEPYTLMIMWRAELIHRFPDISLEVVATDVDAQLLQRARQAVYGRTSLKDLPDDWRQLAFEQLGEDFSLTQTFRTGVKLLRQDIRRQTPPGVFDLVLCRHMALTYFDPPTQREVLNRVQAHMPPGGVLVTAKKEFLPSQCDWFRAWRSPLGVFRRR